MTPRVSVILAVGRFWDDQNRCLAGLVAQQVGTPPFQVVLAARQARLAGLREWPSTLELTKVESPAPTLGAMWKAGANVARGEILLFMRADAVPEPWLLTRHLDLHASDGECLGIGTVLPVEGSVTTTVPDALLGCEGQILSLSRQAYDSVDGFDVRLSWGAEIELAHRLIRKGMVLRRTAGSVARHTRPSSSSDASEGRFRAGRANVELYRHTPALLPHLELGTFHFAGPRAVGFRRLLLALGKPPLPDVGGILPRGKWRDRWRRFAHDYHFWRGAVSASDRTLRRSLIRAPVILMYHAVGRPDERAGWYIVPVRRFARHMGWLAARRYRILSLGELLEYRRRFELPPPRSVVITFDDGYADNYELGYPALRARGFRATFFLVSGCLGGRNAWDKSGELAERPLVSWRSAQELLAGGMEIGCHTRSHPALPELTSTGMAEEIAGSRKELEEGLGEPVRTFAYPFGRLDAATTMAVDQAGFTAACCSRSGVNDPGVPGLVLRRVEIRGYDSLVDFALAVHRGRAVRRRRPT
jgi:peptidoglycan/xylan/chitin deacetylase (PgdA/CDA1 family)